MTKLVEAIKRYYVDNDGTNGDSETMLVGLCLSCVGARRRRHEYIEHAETPPTEEQGDMECMDCGGATE